MDKSKDDPPKKKKKRTDLSGWSVKTTADRIKNMTSHPVLGDWRRFGVIKVKTLVASIKWTKVSTEDILTFSTQCPVGMKSALVKMEDHQNCNFTMLPLVVKEHFDLTEKSYHPTDFQVSVSFGKDPSYSSFSYAYCRLCSNKNVLTKSY